MMTDAELNVLYGAGLKPTTAMRVIDELRQQKAKAEAWEDLAREAIEMLGAVRMVVQRNVDDGEYGSWEEILDILG